MPDGKPTPSEFMRQLRPENYSDTTEGTSYVLDAAVFDHRLETITARNETHEFEIFCRKLCERAICPNLRPQTGPDGGGDSKADAETYPVADEVAIYYVGEANSGREKWGFAFSAKEDWIGKARSDIEGLAQAGRGHTKIIFVTSRYAKAKPRAVLEKKLSEELGIEVTILDRSWIIQQVIECDRKDLAHNYLNVGQEVTGANELGPADYSRKRQLDAIEKALADPSNFTGMERQSVTEALLAAKLSRTMERPQHETDGRFLRAIRLADAHGTFRQKLETRYEQLWTAIWWFDDHAELNSKYGEFERMAIESDHTINLKFLSNLLQTLFNAVLFGHLGREECSLDDRASRLRAKLEAVAGDSERPTNALEAKVLLLKDRLNWAVLNGDADAISDVWPEFSDVVRRARGLGEFDADGLVKIIEVVGNRAGNDPAYGALIDEVADFVTERTGEAEGALILLKRAQKLDFDNRFEMIRLLGKAARLLTKREHAGKLVEALYLLSVAYRGAGLLWAARATCVFAAASIAIEGEASSQIDIEFIPTLELMAWTSLQLRHLPDFLEAIQVLNGCLVAMPLADESKELLRDRLHTFDMALGSYLLNLGAEELGEVEDLPDVLEALGLFTARFALMYALGYEEVLRTDGSLPPEESDETVRAMIHRLASQPVTDDVRGPLITNRSAHRRLEATVMGMTVEIKFEATTTALVLAEAVLAAIEACFATAFELPVHPHTERYEIALIEDEAATEPAFEIDPLKPQAKLVWPKGLSLTSFDRSAKTIRFLTQAALLTMAGSCVLREGTATLDRLMGDEALLERVATISLTANSYHRLFGQDFSSLADRSGQVGQTYPARANRPVIAREKPDQPDKDRDGQPSDADVWWSRRNHRDVRMFSVIDVNLWNAARWSGVFFTLHGPDMPPGFSLLFKDEAAARAIFERWHERFGRVDRDDEIYVSVVREVSDANPAHYNVVVCSNPSKAEALTKSAAMTVTRFNRMQPDVDTNLRRFLAEFDKAGVYLLMPAVMINGQPKLLSDLAILKRNLPVKSAKTLRPDEIEHVSLGEQADAHFAGSDVEPSVVFERD